MCVYIHVCVSVRVQIIYMCLTILAHTFVSQNTLRSLHLSFFYQYDVLIENIGSSLQFFISLNAYMSESFSGLGPICHFSSNVLSHMASRSATECYNGLLSKGLTQPLSQPAVEGLRSNSIFSILVHHSSGDRFLGDCSVAHDHLEAGRKKCKEALLCK